MPARTKPVPQGTSTADTAAGLEPSELLVKTNQNQNGQSKTKTAGSTC